MLNVFQVDSENPIFITKELTKTHKLKFLNLCSWESKIFVLQ